MNPLLAMHLIGILRKKTQKYIPIVAEDLEGTDLIPHHITRNQDGQPIFFFVDRLEYIRVLEIKHALFKKRQSLKNVLRDSLRK